MKVKVLKRSTRRGIIILQDTRETLPIMFSRDESIAAVRKIKLNFGDYQALYPDGSRSSIVFERKSVADLWTTMTKGHERFMNELQRAVKARAKLVLIIEAPFSSILIGFERSKYPGTAMIKKLWTLSHVYGLPFVFCQNRHDMSSYITWSFISEHLHKERMKKGK